MLRRLGAIVASALLTTVPKTARSYLETTAFYKMSTSAYSIVERGSLYSLDYRGFLRGPNGFVSPFHDIPLYANKEQRIFNMFVEIPRWTNAKMEINKEEKLNPLKQDVKKEKPRYVDNCFPHHGYIWNYGALPQTWEDPNHIDSNTNAKGDNDPIDVCEIGSKVHPRGSVVQVKVLGCFALIDEGETDWKVLVIDVTDPLAKQLNDLSDIEQHMPGFLHASREWFKVYKIPQGKPANQFAFNGEPKNRDFALNIIEETHRYWTALMSQQVQATDISIYNTTVNGSATKIEQEDAQAVVDQAPPPEPAQSIPAEVDRWHYIRL